MKKIYFVVPFLIHIIFWFPVRIIFGLFSDFDVKGLENLKKNRGSHIFACNHTSEMDIIVLPAALPFFSHFTPVFFASRESDFYGGSGWRRHFYGGLFFNLLGSYPLVVGLHDYEKSLANQIRIINDGGSICIFPEGRTTPNGQIQSAKGGVAYLAHKTRLPIIPVRIDGLFRFSFVKFITGKIKITVKFGEPIFLYSKDFEEIPIKDCKKQANVIMDIIKNMI